MVFKQSVLLPLFSFDVLRMKIAAGKQIGSLKRDLNKVEVNKGFLEKALENEEQAKAFLEKELNFKRAEFKVCFICTDTPILFLSYI